MTLSVDEFLRRFLLHLLPKGFVRIRNFGFLANRRRATFLAALLSFCLRVTRRRPTKTLQPPMVRKIFGCCPQCGGPMVVIERLTAAEIQLRSPPLPVTAAA